MCSEELCSTMNAYKLYLLFYKVEQRSGSTASQWVAHAYSSVGCSEQHLIPRLNPEFRTLWVSCSETRLHFKEKASGFLLFVDVNFSITILQLLKYSSLFLHFT